jgi:hypothetical protein
LCEFCGWSTQFTFGARYAQLQESLGFNQETLALNSNVLPDFDFYSGAAISNVSFSGEGLTTSISGLHPVGCCNLNFFYNFRTSLLFDDAANNSVQTWANYDSPVNGWAKAYNSAAVNGSSNLFIGELQVGCQWDVDLKCIPGHAFVRTSFEYQYWGMSSAGSAQATSFVGPISGQFRGTTMATSGNASVDLVGFNIATGITW